MNTPANDWAVALLADSQGGGLSETARHHAQRIITAHVTAIIADNERLRQALESVFGLMDQAWLVRNIANDAEPGFAMRQLEPMMKLAKARAALERSTAP